MLNKHFQGDCILSYVILGFPRGTGGEASANAGDGRDAASIPGSGRSPGGGNGSPLQYSCLEKPMDSKAWWATIPKMAKSQT